MEREKIELFGDERLLSGMVAHKSRGHFGGFLGRTVAFGVAIFSMIFILFCVFVGAPIAQGMTDGTSAPGNTVSPSQDGNADVSTSAVSEPEASLPGTDEPVSPGISENVPGITNKSDIYVYDPSLVPSGQTPIRPYDLSLLSYGESFIYNSTKYTPDVRALMSRDSLPRFEYLNAALYPASDPVVLIIHTHGTEAYSPEGAVAYDGVSSLGRSSDICENVVAVGDVLADTLGSHGIKTIHCTVMHDTESYRDSYIRSAETIERYLATYPSIKYVIDLHRDAVSSASGEILRPVTLVGGEVAAQVMCVVGSDEGGADYPGWQENLSFALRLRARLNSDYGDLARPVCLRPSAYNQQYAPVSLLLEIGTAGNYLSEAKVAARLVGEALAELIKN